MTARRETMLSQNKSNEICALNAEKELPYGKGKINGVHGYRNYR